MEMVVIGVVVAFWLTFKNNSQVSSLSAAAADSCSATQETQSSLWNLRVHYLVHKNPLMLLVPSLMNPVYNLLSYFFKIHFNIVFPAMPRYTLSTKHLTLACCSTNICGIHTDSL
jgi:hypothetical protein